MELEVGDVILCTVEKISGTMVFVNIEKTNQQGSINFSEVAPGRIRNIRDYVVPKKSIVCKVLKISPRNIELSLRRVTPKEQKEVKEQYKLERSYKSILRSVLKEKTEEVLKSILEKDEIYNFLENAKENSKELEKEVGKEHAEEIIKILSSQKSKKALLKKKIELHTTEPDGLEKIKNLFKKIKDIEIKYISAGKYLLKIEKEDMKKANHKMKEVLEALSSEAKKNKIEFSQSS